jgi:hypothetical protein
LLCAKIIKFLAGFNPCMSRGEKYTGTRPMINLYKHACPYSKALSHMTQACNFFKQLAVRNHVEYHTYHQMEL